MIIDAHTHILPDRVRDDPALVGASDPWFATCHAGGKRIASAESLLDAMDRHGVDRAVCFTWPFADPALCAEANDYLAGVQRRHGDRLVGFGVVHPDDPGAAAEVLRCARLGLRGIGEMNADAQGWDLLGSAAAAVLQAAVDADLACTLHCSEPVGHEYPGKGTSTPERVLELAQRHPELTLICAHLGGGLPLYAHIAEVAEVCARLYFDTAAQPFVYEPSVYRALVDGVGSDRLLLGSDHPLLDVPRYLRALEEAGLDDGDRERICGLNVARILHL